MYTHSVASLIRYLAAPEKVVHELFRESLHKKLVLNGDFACFLLARIDLTGTVLTDNGGGSMHHTVDQKNAIKYRFLVEIFSWFKHLIFTETSV